MKKLLLTVILLFWRSDKYLSSAESKNDIDYEYSELELDDDLYTHEKLKYRKDENEFFFKSGEKIELRRSIQRKAMIQVGSQIAEELFFDKLLSASTKEELIATLNELSFLMSQYDTAIKLVKKDCGDIVIIYAKHPDINVKTAALRVLTSALQGNPIVQKWAFESNLQSSLNLLSSGDVSKSKISVLSALLRHSSENQEEFLNNDGVRFLFEVIKAEHLDNAVRFKVADLLSDLAIELGDDSDDAQKGRLYEIFFTSMKKAGGCETIARLLEPEYFFTHKKAVECMKVLHDICFDIFLKQWVMDLLLQRAFNYYYLEKDFAREIDVEAKNEIVRELFSVYNRLDSPFP